MNKLKQLFREALPETIGALIATAILSVIGILVNNVLNLEWAIGITVGLIWIACGFITFKRTTSKVIRIGSSQDKHIKNPWEYPRLRTFAVAGFFLIPIIGLSIFAFIAITKPDRFTIVVANFDGPEPEKYRVTESILINLQESMRSYENVEVIGLEETITEIEGNNAAQDLAIENDASVIIWGWYGLTDDAVPLSIHFDLLDPLPLMPQLCSPGEGGVTVQPRTSIESFELQTNLSEALSHLSLITVGLVEFSEGNFSEAIRRFDNALTQADNLSLTPKADIYFLRGYSYYFLDEYDKALENYDQALLLENDFSLAYFQRGLAQVKMGEFEEAVSNFTSALNTDSSNTADIYGFRAGAYTSLGQYSNAIEDFTKSIELGPVTPCPYNSRGRVYLLQKNYELALQDFDRALEIAPGLSEAHVGRGNVFFHQENYEKALTELNLAIKNNPESVEAYNGRAEVNLVLNNTSAAIDDFFKAFQLTDDPEDRSYYETRIRELGETP